jgi:hypothetical protein
LGRRQEALKSRTDNGSSGISEPSSTVSKNWIQAFYVTLGILSISVLFCGIIWVWATITDDGNGNGLPSPWHVFVVSRDLQAKIGGPSAIERLGSCLKETIPHHNATIEEVSRYLRDMRMNESSVE